MSGLELNNLNFSREGFSLSLSAALPQGSKTLLVGASGAGKSTLLSLIAGFLYPKTGAIMWQGKKGKTRHHHKRRKNQKKGKDHKRFLEI